MVLVSRNVCRLRGNGRGCDLRCSTDDEPDGGRREGHAPGECGPGNPVRGDKYDGERGRKCKRGCGFQDFAGILRVLELPPVDKRQFELALGDARLQLPWGGRSPRGLTLSTCVVDNSAVKCESREAECFDADPAQFTIFLKGNQSCLNSRDRRIGR